MSCSLSLSATIQQYFSLRTNQPSATSQQYVSLRTTACSFGWWLMAGADLF
jgi:hypothetical protein